MSEKIIGILGGMGPEATIDLFTKIVKETKVKKDQDHLRILIDNNPKIPDRTLAIQKKGPSPLIQLIRSATVLEKAGADFIIIPCVTAHYYYESLQKRIKIPILHIIEETLEYLQAKLKGISKIGLIATTGTIQTGLFQKAFSHHVIELILPAPKLQKKWVMEAIYGKKGIKVIGPSEDSKMSHPSSLQEFDQAGGTGHHCRLHRDPARVERWRPFCPGDRPHLHLCI